MFCFVNNYPQSIERQKPCTSRMQFICRDGADISLVPEMRWVIFTLIVSKHKQDSNTAYLWRPYQEASVVVEFFGGISTAQAKRNDSCHNSPVALPMSASDLWFDNLAFKQAIPFLSSCGRMKSYQHWFIEKNVWEPDCRSHTSNTQPDFCTLTTASTVCLCSQSTTIRRTRKEKEQTCWRSWSEITLRYVLPSPTSDCWSSLPELVVAIEPPEKR